MTQPTLFDSPPTKGYSYLTSLPAFKENSEAKQRQEDMIYALISQLKETCLLQLSELTGLEQGRISARMSGLIESNRATYQTVDDKPVLIHYGGRWRKKIVVIELT